MLSPSEWAPAASWAARLLETGNLSLVVQGPVSSANHAEVEVNLRHWRRLLPNAQIILSVSSSDLPDLAASDPRRAKQTSAVERLTALCDEVVVAAEVELIAPLKFGETAPNHANYQIAAAVNGLNRVRGAYVLRVRSDLIFTDLTFLRFYFQYARRPRGIPRGFDDRVMISNLFTLNPFSRERLPFHFSDFFHFGRYTDVARLWTALPAYKRADEDYYERHQHAGYSSDLERRFRTRFAVEQHVHFPTARARYGATLQFHNDSTSVEASIDMLVNDFIICDMVECRAHFPKWGFLFDDETMRQLCMNSQDWIELGDMSDAATRAQYLRERSGERPSQLLPGQQVPNGGWIISANRRFGLHPQHDGNCVVYRISEDGNNAPVWATNTVSTGGRLEMTSGGELKFCNGLGRTLWASPWSPDPGSYLEMGNDGRAMIFRRDGRLLAELTAD